MSRLREGMLHSHAARVFRRAIAIALGLALGSLCAACPNGVRPRLVFDIDKQCEIARASRAQIIAARDLIIALNVSDPEHPTQVPELPSFPEMCNTGNVVSIPAPVVAKELAGNAPIEGTILTADSLRAMISKGPCQQNQTGVALDPTEDQRIMICSQGKEIRRAHIDDYVRALSEFEQYLNKYGRSLADPQPGVSSQVTGLGPEGLWLSDPSPKDGEILWRTEIVPKRESRESPARDEGRYEFAEFIGDETFGVGFFADAAGSRDGEGYRVSSGVTVSYKIFGTGEHSLFTGSAEAFAGQELSSSARMTASARLNDDTAFVDTSPYVAELKPKPVEIFKEAAVVVRTFIGPVPVMLQVGLTGQINTDIRAQSGLAAMSASENVGFDVRLFVEAFVGWDVLALGVGGDLQLIGVTGHLKSENIITSSQNEVCLDWTGGPQLTLDALGGSLYLTLSIFVPWEGGIRKYRWEITSYTGVQVPIASDLRKIHSCGPTPCGESAGMCNGACVSLLDDGNCGGCGVSCGEGGYCIRGSCGGCRNFNDDVPYTDRRLGFSCDGAVANMSCESLSDPDDPAWGGNNYLCNYVPGPGDAGKGRVWQPSGAMQDPNYICLKIPESRAGWDNNFLCYQTNCNGECVADAYYYEWLTGRPHDLRGCVAVISPNVPEFRNRYICKRFRG